MLSMVFRAEAPKIMMIITNAILSCSFYRGGSWNSERWFPQWPQRNKWQKWSWEKGCVSPQSSHSWHHCVTVLPSRSPSQTYRAHCYSLCISLRLQHHPQSCLSHRPRITCPVPLPCLQLQSSLRAGEVTPTPISATPLDFSQLPAKSSDRCSALELSPSTPTEAARGSHRSASAWAPFSEAVSLSMRWGMISP